jgi:hypothetical protein
LTRCGPNDDRQQGHVETLFVETLDVHLVLSFDAGTSTLTAVLSFNAGPWPGISQEISGGPGGRG